MTQMNMDDPAKQEAVRRGHHEYIPTAGKHGSYVQRQYDRAKNEYPKMMGKFPRPTMAAFKGKPDADALFQSALSEWDRAMTASVVNSRAEEQAWLKEHGN